MMKQKLVKGKYEYIRLLERYFDLASSMRVGSMLEELGQLERAIKVNKGRHTDRAVLIGRFVVSLIYYAVSSAAMGLAILWAANTVFNYPVAYSFKNIVITSLVFWVGRIKINLFWEQ